MADISVTIQGTTYDYPGSAANPNWAPANIAVIEAIVNALAGLTGVGDISPTQMNIDLYNTVSNQTLVGCLFSTSTIRSAIISYNVYREETSGPTVATESGQLFIVYNGTSWEISRESVGDASITFSITTAGQVKFSTTSIGGGVHTGKIIFSAKALPQTV